MTALVSTLGLMPTALSHGIGSQTQKPLAVVVIGGTLSLALLSRIRMPRCSYSRTVGLTRERGRVSRRPEGGRRFC
jgi:Cu/Ag efflux pump CusA